MLKNGEEAEILGISQDGLWWVIRIPGEEDLSGWVVKDYIVARNDDDVTVMTLESAAKAGTVASPQPGRASLTAAWTVNIRAGPGKEYAIVGTLQQNQTAEIVGVSEDTVWWAIRFDTGESETGWVAAAYVEAQNTQNVPVVK
jgi:SH3-like domain-containing protein